MAIPPIGNIVTPANVLGFSAQGQVTISWDPVPTIQLYYVSRSTDNSLFTELGSTANLSYIDTTGTENLPYYYYVQAADGVSSSPQSPIVVGQNLKIGQNNVANIILECRQRVDRVEADNITSQEWTSMISQSYKWLYNLLVQKFGNDYFVAPPYSYTTTGQLDPIYNAQVFPLPNDFYKLLRCEVALNPADPNSWLTMRQFMALERNNYNYPNMYAVMGITDLRYRLWGGYLEVVPIAAANQTIRIWYAPRPNQLSNLTDIIDGISAYEELMVVDVCIKALAKTEEDPSVFVLQKQELMEEVDQAAENRNISEPQRVTDARSRNNGWYGGTDAGWGGGWGGN